MKKCKMQFQLVSSIRLWMTSFILLILIQGSIFAEKGKPNFLIIIGDDVGYDAFGCTGSADARTPNIDKLATEGLIFDRFYGTVAQCGPIRAELYTGLFPVNNGKLSNSHVIPKKGIKSIVDHLEPLGYQVGISGKSHFGMGKKFKNIKGFPSGANSSISEYTVDGLKHFIQSAQSEGDSFCAVIGSIHAHHPWDLGQEKNFDASKVKLPDHWIDTPSSRKAFVKHAAEVEELDHQVGTTLKLLKEMKLEESTVVIFLSEQGIAMPRAKWTVYDHGNRSLCVMRWPGQIKARRTSALGQYCDILPTLVNIAGGSDPKLDGFSLKPLFEGSYNKHRDFVYLYNIRPTWQRAFIRDDWKLVWSPDQTTEHIWQNFSSKGKFFAQAWAEWLSLAKSNVNVASKVNHVIHPKELELYKLTDDFYEVNNLALNPENKERVSEMLKDLKGFMNDLGDPLYEDYLKSNLAGKKKKSSKKK